MPDKAHARAALRLSHNASPAQRKRIDAKARKVLKVPGPKKGTKVKLSTRSMEYRANKEQK